MIKEPERIELICINADDDPPAFSRETQMDLWEAMKLSAG